MLYIIHIQYSLKPFYIKHYNIIRALQLTGLIKSGSFTLSRKEVWRCLLIVVDVREYIHIMHNTYIHHIFHILNYIIKVKSYLSYAKSGFTNINH